MAIVNVSKPTTSLTNSSRIGISETWDTIPTTWASETRTWDATISIITNATKISSSITNSLKPA